LLSILVILFIVLFVRRKKRPSGPFPEAWRKILLDKVDFYRRLSPEERERFEREVLFFFQEIDITGVDVELTDSDRLLVAASGIIPLFGFPGWHYRNLNEVLLYKDRFNLDYQTQGTDRNINGMVGTGSMQRMMILVAAGTCTRAFGMPTVGMWASTSLCIYWINLTEKRMGCLPSCWSASTPYPGWNTFARKWRLSASASRAFGLTAPPIRPNFSV
jgi:hypothetical protein